MQPEASHRCPARAWSPLLLRLLLLLLLLLLRTAYMRHARHRGTSFLPCCHIQPLEAIVDVLRREPAAAHLPVSGRDIADVIVVTTTSDAGNSSPAGPASGRRDTRCQSEKCSN